MPGHHRPLYAPVDVLSLIIPCNPTLSCTVLLSYFFFGCTSPDRSDGKESTWNAEDPGSIPGSGRSPGEGNGNPLQCSCLENSTDRGPSWATVHGVTNSWTRLSNFHPQLQSSGISLWPFCLEFCLPVLFIRFRSEVPPLEISLNF